MKRTERKSKVRDSLGSFCSANYKACFVTITIDSRFADPRCFSQFQADAIAAMGNGAKTANGATADPTGLAVPWIAGNTSYAGDNNISGPPNPAHHPSRKGVHSAPTAPLPLHLSNVGTSFGPGAASSSATIPTHLSTPRHPPPRSRPRLFDLEEAPTFYPTWEEFADPLKFIEWVGSPEGGNGKEYGIVKIVPPEGWNPEFVLDQEVRSDDA